MKKNKTLKDKMKKITLEKDFICTECLMINKVKEKLFKRTMKYTYKMINCPFCKKKTLQLSVGKKENMLESLESPIYNDKLEERTYQLVKKVSGRIC